MVSIVWFKRDLRISDHAPLLEACRSGDVIPLYICEPELWAQPDASNRHWQFVRESLRELDAELRARGASLILRKGDAVQVFAQLKEQHGVTHIYTHEETGNDWSYQRDKHVLTWAEAQDVAVKAYAQHGVKRGLQDRDKWIAYREAVMRAAVIEAPDHIPIMPNVESEKLPDTDAYGDAKYACPKRQTGGSRAAWETLQSFFDTRGERYQREMSSPLEGEWSCSRISPYLAYGCISMRETWHALQGQIEQLSQERRGGMWLRSMRSFQSRLYWHCHFIQKLESEPEIETHPMHRGYIGLREDAFDERLFEAWKEGRTGFPFVDACMRSLIATGWLNFRMRAMLVSFASYQLWLHWERTAWHLAQLFTDYEPGIHYSQIQMQSNTTGINTPRIYNPVKQSFDQDPEGVFIRRWLPELEKVPTEWIHEPWKMDDAMRARYQAADYPMPVIDLVTATRAARSKLGALRKSEGFWEESRRVLHKHGSRKHREFPQDSIRKRMKKAPARAKPKVSQQLDLDI